MKYIFRLLLVILLTHTILFAESFQKPPYDERLNLKVDGKIWYDAADTDYVAAYNIGVFYDQELKDYKLAEFWYKNSWDIKKNSNASYNLASIYADKKRYKEAINWYKKASQLNDKDATNNLAYLYDTVFNDTKNAEKWYQKAIERESLDAMKNLGRLYHFKLNDDVKAAEYFIALIDNKYPKNKVFGYLKNKWKLSDETIKKGYEAQLKSTIIPEKLKYKGGI